MELVQNLIACSEKLLAMLHNQEIDREEKIRGIEDLLAKREEIISELKNQSEPIASLPSENTKIVKLEQEISSGLKGLFDSIKNDLKGLKQRKISHQPYINPYSKLASFDGRYYDKRK